MDDLFAHALCLNEFQRDVVILIAFKAGAQRTDLHREGKAHLDAGIKAVEVSDISLERRLDHFETEGALCLFVEGPHDP